MYARKWFYLGAVLALLAVFAMAQQPTPANEPVIKHVPVRPTSAASGPEMFASYCAVCHGADGKGNGPAASALKAPPTNLTALSKNDRGKYSSAHRARGCLGT